MGQSVIAVALVLGGLIFFHELGHFLIARLFGIGVVKFSLGFGPKLASFKGGLTEYRLSAVPLGGYVHLAGEGSDEGLAEGFAPAHNFRQRPAWQRMCVVAAGPIFNFVLAFLIYWGVFFAMGQPEMLPVAGDIQPDSPALAAGLEKGDRVLAIDGREISTWTEMTDIIQAKGRQEAPLLFSVRRGDQTLDLPVKPKLNARKNIFGEEVSMPMIGVASAGEVVTRELGFVESAGAGLTQTWLVVKLTVQGLVKIIERVVPIESIGGPIMIAQLVSQQAKEGLANVLALAAVISVNLGLINLLPIPVLDGGHILFFGLETILGKPLSERWQSITTRLGLVFLLMLMLLALYNDLVRVL